jgi:VWFA-related protein
MKPRQVWVAVLVGALFAATVARGQTIAPEAFSAAAKSSADAGDFVAASDQASGLYSDGMRAIDESRWSDAVSIFTKVAGEQGEFSDGALYWKAYAENKQGHSSLALSTCLELRHGHPKSRWLEECGALEIEIRANNGQPTQPQAEQNNDLKLLALNALMKQDELRALSEIQQILSGDFAEPFKERALFILAQGQSKQAQALVEQIAQARSNVALQAKAAEILAIRRDIQAGSPALATDSANRALTLDVVVTDKSGKPVGGLQPQDFTLLDNKQPRDIISFHAADGALARSDTPVEVILLLDGINSSVNAVARIRQEVVKYLRQNGGHLALPTSLIFLSDAGTRIQITPTRDGNELIADLEDNSTGLRTFKRSEGFYSAEQCRQLSLRALDRIAMNLGKKPGRKLLIWISPGWPAFSRQSSFNSKKQQQEVFDYVAGVSVALREARIAIYSVDPEGVGHEQFYFENFVKGVSAAKKTDYGDLLLQVLAYQTGGLVFSGSNDIAGLIERCAADANAYYLLTFNSPAASYPNEYHGVEVRMGKPGLRARTRTGYYAQR